MSKYRGALSAMLASFPGAGMFWLSYEYSKYQLRGYNSLTFNQQNAIAAAIGETCQAIIRNPSEVIKQNLQIGNHETMREAARSIYRTSGLRGFYAGYWSLVMREVPFGSI